MPLRIKLSHDKKEGENSSSQVKPYFFKKGLSGLRILQENGDKNENSSTSSSVINVDLENRISQILNQKKASLITPPN
jgi:hypothetical protein